MRIRAAIFDIYQTLLHVGPPPAESAVRWRWLWENSFGRKPRLDLATFHEACEAIIQREHEGARARGIAHPEVYWPGVMAEVLPELSTLPRRARNAFELAQARLIHTTALSPGAAPVLRLLISSGVALGIASNAQPHTPHELDEALTAVGLGTDVFQKQLIFWSFEHGYSKPDPHVFQVLTARLKAFGVKPSEIVMVGDRMDNDVLPARACGWQGFRITPEGPGDADGGDWQGLARWLDGRLVS